MKTVSRWGLVMGSALCIIIGTGCGSSSKPLGEYRGSLSELFPEKVGDFKREQARSRETSGPGFYGATAAYQALYTSDKTAIDFQAINFPSEEKAKEAVRQMAREPTNRDIREDTKDLGNRVQGRTGPHDTLFVLWTNGSVVFTLDSADYYPGQLQKTTKSPGEEPSLNPDERDRLILTFERDFPYNITSGESFQIQPRRSPTTKPNLNAPSNVSTTTH
jgi:hypothetical protein